MLEQSEKFAQLIGCSRSSLIEFEISVQSNYCNNSLLTSEIVETLSNSKNPSSILISFYFFAFAAEHEQAMAKFSRVSKKKDSDKVSNN